MMAVEISDLDQMQSAYKTAVDNWISAIREEESLASCEHSETEIDTWEAAGFREKMPAKRPNRQKGTTKRPSARSSSTSSIAVGSIHRDKSPATRKGRRHFAQFVPLPSRW
jgi:hypothetical protein